MIGKNIYEFFANSADAETLQEYLQVKKQAMGNSITGIVIAPADGHINYANMAFLA